MSHLTRGYGAAFINAGGYTCLDDTSVQSMFTSAKDALSLPVGTYEYEINFIWTGSGNAISHTTSVGFGGTATIGAIGGAAFAAVRSLSSYSATSSAFGVRNDVALIVGAAAATNPAGMWYERGIFTVTVAGTIIPQFQFSAAPGNSPSVRTGTFFRVRQLAANPSGIWS
jgi:hypothetical protein